MARRSDDARTPATPRSAATPSRAASELGARVDHATASAAAEAGAARAQHGAGRADGAFALVSEYLELARRRRTASPPLSSDQLRRWRWLRREIEDLVSKGSKNPPPDCRLIERRALRVPTRQQIEFSDGSRRVCGFLAQIGEGGAFVATDLPFERGTTICLEIGGPASAGAEELLIVEGAVCWTRPRQHDGLPAGMGLVFGALDSQQHDRILELVERALFAALARRRA